MARDLEAVLEWAVDKARENLRRVERMRADEECGSATVDEAQNWLNLCQKVAKAAWNGEYS
jgi:hypothetical protein